MGFDGTVGKASKKRSWSILIRIPYWYRLKSYRTKGTENGRFRALCHYTANLRSEDDGTFKFLVLTTSYFRGVGKFSERSEKLDLRPILSPALQFGGRGLKFLAVPTVRFCDWYNYNDPTLCVPSYKCQICRTERDRKIIDHPDETNCRLLWRSDR